MLKERWGRIGKDKKKGRKKRKKKGKRKKEKEKKGRDGQSLPFPKVKEQRNEINNEEMTIEESK